MTEFLAYVEPTSFEELELRNQLLRSPLTIKRTDIEKVGNQEPRFKALKRRLNVKDAKHVASTTVLGSGEFGLVERGSIKSSCPIVNAHGPVAIKTIPNNASAKAKSSFLQEIIVMAQFDHPNVVKLLCHCVSGDDCILVMELCDIALDALLINKKDAILVGPRMRYALDVAKGLSYLQKKNFVHRDIAARNILLSQGSCKIGDFGMSTPLAHQGDFYKSSGGKVPLRWCALETIIYRHFSLKTDIWAFGIMLHEIFDNGNLPYGKIKNRDLPKAIESGYRLPPVGCCPLQVYELMLRCWDVRPSNRPSAEAIYKELFQCARFKKDELATVHFQRKEMNSNEDLDEDDEYEYTTPPQRPSQSKPESKPEMNSLVVGDYDAFDLERMIADEIKLSSENAPKVPPLKPEPKQQRHRPSPNAVSEAPPPAPPRRNSSFQGDPAWFCPHPISREVAEKALSALERKNVGIPGTFFVRMRQEDRSQIVISMIHQKGVFKHYTIFHDTKANVCYLAERIVPGCYTLKQVIKKLYTAIPEIHWYVKLRNAPGQQFLNSINKL